MKYLQKSFQSTPPTDAYRKGYDKIRWAAKPAKPAPKKKPK
jgi:hypothetical protein